MKKLKSKPLILDNASLEEEFFEDIALFGIVCAVEPYQLAWSINESSNFNFERTIDSDIEVDEVYYRVYKFYDDVKLLEHFLISNRFKTDFMLKEIKNIDYIWMIKGFNQSSDFKIQISNLLKSLRPIDSFFEITPMQIKMKQYLII